MLFNVIHGGQYFYDGTKITPEEYARALNSNSGITVIVNGGCQVTKDLENGIVGRVALLGRNITDISGTVEDNSGYAADWSKQIKETEKYLGKEGIVTTYYTRHGHKVTLTSLTPRDGLPLEKDIYDTPPEDISWQDTIDCNDFYKDEQ